MGRQHTHIGLNNVGQDKQLGVPMLVDITVHVAHIWRVIMQPGTEDQALCDDFFGDTFKTFGLVFRGRGGGEGLS